MLTILEKSLSLYQVYGSGLSYEPVNTGWNSSFSAWQEQRTASAAEMIAIFFIRLESEVNVQHIIDTRHIEVLGVELLVAFLA